MKKIELDNSIIDQRTICKMIAEHMKLMHSRVIYRFDFASSINVTKSQKEEHEKLNCHKSYPTLFICEIRGKYHGAFLNIKKEGDSPYIREKQTLKQDIDTLDQADFIVRLRKRGYYSEFGIGYNDCIQKIDSYLKIKSSEK